MRRVRVDESKNDVFAVPPAPSEESARANLRRRAHRERGRGSRMKKNHSGQNVPLFGARGPCEDCECEPNGDEDRSHSDVSKMPKCDLPNASPGARGAALFTKGPPGRQKRIV